jgi:hypothetical protein
VTVLTSTEKGGEVLRQEVGFSLNRHALHGVERVVGMARRIGMQSRPWWVASGMWRA